MTSPRRSAATALGCGVLALAVLALAGGPPDLRPVMPEVDGVHPVRALQALHTAYAPGAGFPDKYPPLGSCLLGLAAARADNWFDADAPDVARQPDAERRVVLWRLRDRVAAMLAAERWVSRGTMALAVALVALIALQSGVRLTGALLGALIFLLSYPALHYGGTANVDALALAASLLALWCALSGRGLAAGVALGLAVAIKDPAFVLAPVLLVAVGRSGGPGAPRRTAGLLAAAALSYALAAGALLSPAAWWEHVRYVLQSGVGSVDRIDHARPAEWWLLLRYTAELLAGAIGWTGLALGLLGVGELSRRNRTAAGVLGGALAATLVLFVLPVGFVFVRFLLLPLAVLAIGAGAVLERLGARLASGAGRQRVAAALALAALAALAMLLDRGAADYHRFTLRAGDPRREVVGVLHELAPPGSRIVCLADEREHGPPLDPTLWSVQNLRLHELEHLLPAWRDHPDQRPDYVLWMGFPLELPSGRGPARSEPPLLGPPWEVVADLGAEGGGSAAHTLAVRPRVVVMRRAPE